MSVVGFDIGNLNCYIAIARQGGIEVITNDYSLHATPACVSFGAKQRSMGVAARQSVNSNFKNTVLNYKHLIGRKFSDPITQKLIKLVPCGAVQLENDNIGIKVRYLEKEAVFTVEQIYACLLTKLKEIVESQVTEIKKVSDCVVSIPGFFTDVQRRAVISAVQCANLNPLRIMNESTAIALAYGIYKQDLPEAVEGVRPRHVVFLDIGHSATQACLVAFNKGRLQVLAYNFDLDVGGLYFDILIAEHFCAEFKTKYGIDASTSPRAWLRLLDESEKVKKQMSANSTPIPINIECFMEDKDVTAKLQRTDFENLATNKFEKISNLLKRLVAESGVNVADIDEIEIVGGSSRIPMVRTIVKDIFDKDAKTTMNQDEAVARGAAMQCAILSPAFRVREFSVKDCQPYRIHLTWKGGAPEGGESDVFVERDEFPYSKVITLYRSSDFQIDAKYALPETVPHSTSDIGVWKFRGITPAADGQARKVKVKVRVTPNGTFTICSASSTEVIPVEEEAPQESMEETPAEGAEAKPAEPKQKTKSVEYALDELFPDVYNGLQYAGVEEEMQRADLFEKKKADAKNSVEEYVYEMRDKLSDQLSGFVTGGDADMFRSYLSTTEEWLYDEGEDTEIQVYEDRLAELKKIGDPIVERYRESISRKPAFDAFDQSILRVRKAYEDYRSGANYAHIESKDMEKVCNAIDEYKKWIDDARQRQGNKSQTEAPVVFVHEIKQQQEAFDSIVKPILNKKPPKPQPAPTPAPPAGGGAPGAAPGAAPTNPDPLSSEMEVD
ncbi:unnamed protein product [Auanema sp. JU1783]|nr:unnamed protein product [Auanema sp. JU1783]